MSTTASTLHLMATVPSETWFARRALLLSKKWLSFWVEHARCMHCALLVQTPGVTRRVCAMQVQDRAVQSSEQWQDGRLLFERLQTLPNYEKCAWLCCTLLCLSHLEDSLLTLVAVLHRWVRTHAQSLASFDCHRTTCQGLLVFHAVPLSCGSLRLPSLLRCPASAVLTSNHRT